jgi:multidrug resistance efflux pump
VELFVSAITFPRAAIALIPGTERVFTPVAHQRLNGAVDESQNRAETNMADKATLTSATAQAARKPKTFAPVPTPASVRWREFRASVLPVAVFAVGVFIAVICWQHVGTNTGVAGMGEGARSMVSSPFAASVREVLVAPYQQVKAGDIVAVIVPNDPRVEMDLLQTELDLARIQLQPTIAEENAMNFEQIRVDLLRTRAELAVARVNLERMENQVRRQEPLFREKLVSEDIFDLATKTRDMFAVEVFEKSNALAHIEKRLGELESLGIPQFGATNSPVFTALGRLRLLQSAVATNWGPITLRAPIDGMVTGILRRSGESVVGGEPLLSISSARAERVVGYLRQPYTVQPEVGAQLILTTRERHPRQLTGVVTEIGAQVEIITNALAFVQPGKLVDAGLPLIVSLPENAGIRPGEIVDISFRKPRAGDVTARPRSAQQARAE